MQARLHTFSHRAFPAAYVALALAGCGGSDKPSATGDPATLVPAAAPVYVEAVVRPEGDVRSDVEGALRKLLRTDDPAKRLRELFDDVARDDDVTYERDLEPWLGRRVGIFFTSFAGESGTGAVIAATTDADKARDALRRAGRSGGEGKATSRRYKGVSYEVSEDDTASGIVDGFAVAGTEDGFKQVVDTRRSPSLARSADFRDARGRLPDAAVVTAYADPDGLVDAIAGAAGVSGQELGPLRGTLAGAGTRALGVGLSVEPTALRVDTAALQSQPQRRGDPGASSLVAGLPGDAWLAVGIRDLGATARNGLEQLSNLAALGGEDLDRALREIRRASGLDVRRDLFSWMGDAGLFVRGTSLTTVGAGLVIESEDPARSRAAIGKLGRLLRGIDGLRVSGLDRSGVDAGIAVASTAFPIRVEIASAGERFVIAVTDAAMREALRPSRRLAEAPGFRSAGAKLGAGLAPSFFLDPRSLLTLLEGLGLGTDSSYRAAKPYLEALGPVAAAGRQEGEIARGRLAIVLR
jgi:hypothetical protein